MLEYLSPLLVSLGFYQAAPCSQEKIIEILASPEPGTPSNIDTWKNKEVKIDCSVTLPAGSVVTKWVRFVGPEASNTVFDCNGATIKPAPHMRAAQATIDVLPRRSLVDGAYSYSRPSNVLVKNCDIYGSVRISSSYYRPAPEYNDNADLINYVNNTGPDYVRQVRETSPKRITFDNIHVTNNGDIKDTFYFEVGVTESTLKNSVLVDDTDGVMLYLAAEAAFNTIDNNEFHHSTPTFDNAREIIAVDAAEHNTITNNWFSGGDRGAIELYRNCGESGKVRYTGPRYNKISNNIFYYSSSWYSGEVAIEVASRNGDSGSMTWDCWDDTDAPDWNISHVDPSWGWDSDWEASSSVNYDYARYNIISYNKFCNVTTDKWYKVRNPDFNFGNMHVYSQGIACDSSTPIPRK